MRRGSIETEKGFTQAVRQLARMLGWLEYHPYDSRKSTPGFPDLTLIKDGRLIFAELKTVKGTLTPDQRLWASAIVKTPAEYYIWRPADWPDIERILTNRRDAENEG